MVGIVIRCRPRTGAANCSCCGQASNRLHSHYERRMADLPWQGHRVRIHLRVRRLRCDNSLCARQIFAETASDVVEPYGRRLRRLSNVLRWVGLGLGGEAGARLLDRLGMPASADTLLRVVRTPDRPSCSTPRVLGVDDWAWRKGQRYGTILVDLETNEIIDLLADREAATLARWLTEHAGVKVIARDRAGAYALGAREGAPEAQQVADRWHLLRNCSEALLDVLERGHRVVREIGKSLADQNMPCRESPSGAYRASKAARLQTERRHRRRALFDRVMELSRLGWSQLAIKRELGTDLKTIRKWQRDKAPGSWERTVFKPDAVEPFEEYLRQRWAQGCRNATQLYREICGQGYQGNAKAFRCWVKVRLREGTPAPTSRPATPRQAARLVTKERDMLAQPDREFVQALCTASPEITRAAGLARRFQAMIQTRDSDALAGWLEDTLMSPPASLARGLLRDVDAVRAALSLPWSSGPVEGKIHKLKLIKRSMYGRAGLDLLRVRVMGS
ncbi:MAG TPA: ISL3 family transposase [Pedomonas sp.]|uniref:ISL3 family transposase n=1 Tax=Pedomonas sp. TaxID=2976421 RepID=UPI002F3EF01B